MRYSQSCSNRLDEALSLGEEVLEFSTVLVVVESSFVLVLFNDGKGLWSVGGFTDVVLASRAKGTW